jgi:hypothetical protein
MITRWQKYLELVEKLGAKTILVQTGNDLVVEVGVRIQIAGGKTQRPVTRISKRGTPNEVVDGLWEDLTSLPGNRHIRAGRKRLVFDKETQRFRNRKEGEGVERGVRIPYGSPFTRF